MGDARVGILMGSDSDLPVMEKAKQALKDCGIGYELRIMSAHRTPADVAEYSGSARERGLQVIIAGAGLAAHLAGAVAANTTLPVIGVPIEGGSLRGMDALLATVQMPSGVPVATVAVNGATNAGLLAAQIIGAADEAVAAKLAELKQQGAEKARAKNREHAEG